MVLLGIVKSYRVKSYRILDKPSGDQLDTYFGQKSENKMIEHPKSFSVFSYISCLSGEPQNLLAEYVAPNKKWVG